MIEQTPVVLLAKLAFLARREVGPRAPFWKCDGPFTETRQFSLADNAYKGGASGDTVFCWGTICLSSQAQNIIENLKIYIKIPKYWGRLRPPPVPPLSNFVIISFPGARIPARVLKISVLHFL